MSDDATVALVGAGPLGLELAIALKRAKISYLQFDKEQIAQKIYNFPPQTHFFSSAEKIGIAGVPIQTVDQQKCSRETYLAYIRALVMQNQLQIHTHEEVIKIRPLTPNGFQLETYSSKGKQFYQVRYVVLATGSTSSHKSLGVPGEDLDHVSNKMEDPHHYFRKRIVIVGGKNSAVECALRCFHAGAYVSLIMRAKQFDSSAIKYWLLPELKSHIEKGEISCFNESEVVEILTDRVIFTKRGQSHPMEISADFVIKAIGFTADMRLCHELGIAMSSGEEKPLFNEDTMATSVPGVFVLGTLIGGTQKSYRVFIENTHHHVEKIIRALSVDLGMAVSKGAEELLISNKTIALEE